MMIYDPPNSKKSTLSAAPIFLRLQLLGPMKPKLGRAVSVRFRNIMAQHFVQFTAVYFMEGLHTFKLI